jgi:hypothetical protein
MNDHYPVRGCVDIELDCIRPQLDRLQEGGQRVFGQVIVCATVRDSERGTTALVQDFLRTFALGKANL